MSTDVLIDPNVEYCSLQDEARLEALRERWIRSQEAGCDMGEQVIRQWVKKHWAGFLRERWIEHMQGRRFWVELPREEFGLLKRRAVLDACHLLEEIIEQVRCGAENLDIIRWARQTKSTAEQLTIFEILCLININAHRLECSFGTDCG
jgi:hypothetical protein